MRYLMICFLGVKRSARNRVAARYLNNGFVYSEIDFCSSCAKETEYICVTCGVAVCNRCSIAEENDEVSGWRPARSVSYCKKCSSEANESRLIESFQRSKRKQISGDSEVSKNVYIYAFPDLP